ncbi:LOW QUALITY PROTEIN: F-box/kelch-repeat protein OR23-like [Prosopis cineraria]|uniref:LOW QUALITY PROTEIN: F-box/kelch-repeat protein OR23-like n=1 Tax=Prosopis cineraria TaxID=364024 RepID=UPI002410A94C|nr:LOW QUALITY PROTEIN: F-box/kelch-repeat protein OR23-like [Prosopis cineraria]
MIESLPPPPSPPQSTTPPTTDQTFTLIPGLPVDVAALILSFIPYSHHARLKPTCKSWKFFLSSKAFISLRRHHRHLSHLLCIFPQDPSIDSPFLFDPSSLAWCPLPLMPCNPHVYGLCNFSSISIGPHLYVLGGSLFDTRSFPMDRPSPTSSTFRFNFHDFSWERLAPMLSPRGSFACAAVPDSQQILVAGGGSRHTMFAAAGSRICSVERYDIRKDEWVAMDELPNYRAGCVGLFVRNRKGDSREFWVMGGYGASRTISGVFPVDEYYRDAVVMELKDGFDDGRWRETGDMLGDGKRMRLGKIVVVEDENQDYPGIFMLHRNEILRYDMSSNRWLCESRVPRKPLHNSSFGFVVLDGELYVMTHSSVVDMTERRRTRHHKKAGSLFIQIYNPKKRTWRSLVTNLPFSCPIDINTTVLSSICL